MRCRVGDLVVVVSCDYLPQNVGRYGTIVEAVAARDRYAWPRDWWVKPACRFAGYNDALRIADDDGEVAFSDDQLRPLRDPGPEAVDETLAWKPVPTDHKEIA